MAAMLRLSHPPAHPLVAASILSADFGRMADECRDVLDRGADLLHIDVMDGHFVPNLTMGPDMVRGLRRHFPETYLDVHLMVEQPGDFLAAFAEAGANLCSFHLERCTAGGGTLDAEALIAATHELGMEAGMVVNPPTAVEPLEPLLDELELVLVMSVNPGRSGQRFIPAVLPKLQWLRSRVGEGTRLQIDGGISPDTVDQAVAAGADVLVSASSLFGANDRTAVLERFHTATGA